MIYNVVIFGWAIRLRQIWITAQLREISNLNRGEAAQDRIRDSRIDAVSAQRRGDIVHMVKAVMEIPAEAQVVYPGGIGSPGPAGSNKLSAEASVVPEIWLRDSRVRYALGDCGAVAEKVRPREGMMIAEMIIDFAEDIVNADDVGEAISLGAGVGAGVCVDPKER